MHRRRLVNHLLSQSNTGPFILSILLFSLSVSYADYPLFSCFGFFIVSVQYYYCFPEICKYYEKLTYICDSRKEEIGAIRIVKFIPFPLFEFFEMFLLSFQENPDALLYVAGKCRNFQG